MQTIKMSLANIKGKLSRDEMKKIMAGSGTTTCTSTCWDSNVGGNILGSVEVPDCNTNAGGCRSTYPDAVKASCSCSQ